MSGSDQGDQLDEISKDDEGEISSTTPDNGGIQPNSSKAAKTDSEGVPNDLDHSEDSPRNSELDKDSNIASTTAEAVQVMEKSTASTSQADKGVQNITTNSPDINVTLQPKDIEVIDPNKQESPSPLSKDIAETESSSIGEDLELRWEDDDDDVADENTPTDDVLMLLDQEIAIIDDAIDEAQNKRDLNTESFIVSESVIESNEPIKVKETPETLNSGKNLDETLENVKKPDKNIIKQDDSDDVLMKDDSFDETNKIIKEIDTLHDKIEETDKCDDADTQNSENIDNIDSLIKKNINTDIVKTENKVNSTKPDKIASQIADVEEMDLDIPLEETEDILKYSTEPPTENKTIQTPTKNLESGEKSLTELEKIENNELLTKEDEDVSMDVTGKTVKSDCSKSTCSKESNCKVSEIDQDKEDKTNESEQTETNIAYDNKVDENDSQLDDSILDSTITPNVHHRIKKPNVMLDIPTQELSDIEAELDNDEDHIELVNKEIAREKTPESDKMDSVSPSKLNVKKDLDENIKDLNITVSSELKTNEPKIPSIEMETTTSKLNTNTEFPNKPSISMKDISVSKIEHFDIQPIITEIVDENIDRKPFLQDEIEIGDETMYKEIHKNDDEKPSTSKLGHKSEEQPSTSKTIHKVDDAKPSTSKFKQECLNFDVPQDEEPSTSKVDVVSEKLTSEVAEKVQEITDSLGLLAESSRMHDDDEEEDEDLEGLDNDNDDEEDENSDLSDDTSNQIIEENEDSRTPTPGMDKMDKSPPSNGSDEDTTDDIECIENEIPQIDITEDDVSETPSEENKEKDNTETKKAEEKIADQPEKDIIETKPSKLLTVEVEGSSDSEDVDTGYNLTYVSLPVEVDVMSSGTNAASEIMKMNGEVIITGVPKPTPVKASKLNTSEVTIKAGTSGSTLRIPETTKNKAKSNVSQEQVYSLDSDEEDKVEEKSKPSEEITRKSDKVSPTTDEITVINEEVTTINKEVTTIGEEVTTINEEVTTIGEEVTTINEEVTTISEEVTSISEVVTPTSENIMPISGEITPTSEDITPISDEIRPNSEDITTKSDEITTTSEEITPNSEKITPKSKKTESKQEEQENSTDRKCINPDCMNESSFYYEADRAEAAYYSHTKKGAVCEQCRLRARKRSEALLKGIKELCPLLDLEMEAPSQQLVEISDSDDDEDMGDDTETVGVEGAKFLEENLADMINETWTKYKMESRLKDTEAYLTSELEKIEAGAKELNEMLDECQKKTDAIRIDFYKDYEPRRKIHPGIVIYDTAFSSYSCAEQAEQKHFEEADENASETIAGRYPKRRYTSSMDLHPAKRPAMPFGSIPLDRKRLEHSSTRDEYKDDDKEDISVVKLSSESAPASLPPCGEIVRAPLQVGMQVYAMRNAFGAWLRGRLVELQPKSASQQFTQCRVKFEHKVKNACKMLAARCLAYPEPSEVRMTIGTRVIALFRDPQNTTRRDSFYSGVVAEVPNPVNNYRYLVFFDDGYAQYVHHQDTRLVCESSTLVWEEVHPFISDFICNYLLSYPERPMVRLHAGENLKTEWNGKWWDSKVIQVDASIALIFFDEDNRTEWIYRGSTRLAPLYLELKAAEKAGEGKTRSRLPRSKAQMRSNMPCVEYTRSEATAKRIAAETQEQEAFTDMPISSMRAVARKSTTTTSASNDDLASYEGIISRVVYYTPKNAVKPLKMTTHTCTIKCKRTDLLSLKDLRTYNPLAKPLLSGWERQTIRFKGNAREIMYRAPCGRRLRNMAELHKYLRIVQSDLAVDLFDFTPGTHCLAEFMLNKCIVGKKDLSHGKETVPVPCVNYYDESLPEFCSYNTERTPTAGVPLNLDPDFLCGCDCTDDCIDKSKCACWKMTLEGAKTIGLDDPNVGYVYRRLPEPLPSGIYECNSRCKCKLTCLNRVAQHPLQVKLQVFKTINRGWGIRALNDVPKGSFLCVYAGNLLTDATANLDGLNEGDEYLAELDYIEVVEAMKEGYEDDIPEANKKLDMKLTSSQSESSSESEEEKDPSEKDGDFRPDRYLPYNNMEFQKSLRKREKSKKKKETKDQDTEKKDDCITISDDEEVREPSRFTAQAGFDKDLISKQSSRVSVRTLYGKDEACYIMDAKVQGNIGRYLNHSCHPNVFVQNVFVDTHDPRFPWVAFFALSAVRAGTELTWNYNYDIGSVPGKVLYCYCGAPNCRGRLL